MAVRQRPGTQQPGSGRARREKPKRRWLLIRLAVLAALGLAGYAAVERNNRATRDAFAAYARLERRIDEGQFRFQTIEALQHLVGEKPVKTTVDERGYDRETYVWKGVLRDYELTAVYDDFVVNGVYCVELVRVEVNWGVAGEKAVEAHGRKRR